MSIGSNGPKQRPKLNLTVKKELQGLGGQIMAQAKMAKVSGLRCDNCWSGMIAKSFFLGTGP